MKGTYTAAVVDRLRTIAGLTIFLFATEIVALPCGAACHQTEGAELQPIAISRLR